MNAGQLQNARRGFSLVELLVVVGVIAVLMGILIPVMSKARTAANRTACGAQLRDIGNSFQMYLNENKGRLPGLNPLPGVTPAFNSAPSLYDVFDRYNGGNRNIWKCPADKFLLDGRPASAGDAETYFEAYGVSYEYNFWMNENYGLEGIRNGKPQLSNAPFEVALSDARKKNINADRYRIFNDFTYFHGKKGAIGNMNFLFADWHVADMDGASSAVRISATGIKP